MLRLFSIIFSVLIAVSVFPQKKEISQARSDIKKRSNLEQAEKSMRELLKDSANKGNVKIYETLAEAIKAQYEVANEKLYLKEPFDTASFFTTVHKMFLAYEQLDSIDMQPDKKGRVKLKYRKKNAEFLNKYRPNLYSGGVYFVRKNNFASAYSLMDAYLDCRRQPLFAGYSEAKDSYKSLMGPLPIACYHGV